MVEGSFTVNTDLWSFVKNLEHRVTSLGRHRFLSDAGYYLLEWPFNSTKMGTIELGIVTGQVVSYTIPITAGYFTPESEIRRKRSNPRAIVFDASTRKRDQLAVVTKCYLNEVIGGFSILLRVIAGIWPEAATGLASPRLQQELHRLTSDAEKDAWKPVVEGVRQRDTNKGSSGRELGTQGGTLERVKEARRLITEDGLTKTAACKKAGTDPRTYDRYTVEVMDTLPGAWGVEPMTFGRDEPDT